VKILDVGGGFYRYPGSVIIDGNKDAKPEFLHNLNDFPWPIKDSEFDMVYSSHCIEHLSDPKKAVEEIWRVAKPGALVVIKIPHFSSRVAWTDIEHTRAFSTNMLRKYTQEFSKFNSTQVRFEIKKIRLQWQQRIDRELIPAKIRLFIPAINILNTVITGLANFNTDFCERIWCYYVGGMGEVQFFAKVIKVTKVI
jgi:SAM-dependent methyltransferase